MQNHGFTNCSGDENDTVYPKGPSGESYLPLDHFGGQYYFAPKSTGTPVNNIAVKVKVDKTNKSFEYMIESAFD